MYLKRIELYGFKSFGNKVEINFNHRVTGVVGPNGSGKSNIVDAIRWVLGEQRPKSLRGGKMGEVIFAGTDEKKPLGYAQVSLVLDNSSKHFDIDYDEINITRRLFRSGESEYYINKNQVRLKDIHELFMDTGLGREGYSIISQGQIENIVNNSAIDRKLMIEEAAGIVKYKTRKNEAERKLEKTQNNLYRVTDIIAELSSRLPSLKRQSEKAKKYLDIRDELRNIEINLFVHQMEKHNKKLEALNSDEKIIKDNLLDILEQKALLDSRYTSLKIKLNDFDEKIQKCSEERLSLANNYESAKTTIEVNKSKIDNKLSEIDRLEKEIVNLKKSLEEEYKDRENIKSLLDEALKEANSFKAIYDEDKKEVDALYQKTKESSNYLSDLEIKREKAEKEISRINEEISSLKNKKINQEFVVTKLEEENISLQNELVEINNKINEFDKDSNEGFENLKIEVEKALDEKQNKAKEYEGYKASLLTLSNNIQLKASRLDMLKGYEEQKEGYRYGVKQLIEYKKRDNLLKDGMYGVISDLIKVEEKYTNAIQKSLGASLENIVVKDEACAKRAIEVLKQNSWGRITFLPLNVIKGNPLRENFSSEKGFLGLGSQLVAVDNKFINIINNLLGRVLVFDTMDNAFSFAKKTAYSYKVVTLEGEILFAGGAMVGGKSKKDEGGILKRKSEIEKLEKEVASFKEEYETLLLKGDSYKRQIDLIEDKANKALEKLNEAKVALMARKQKNEDIKEQGIACRSKIEKNNSAITSLKEDNLSFEENNQNLINQIALIKKGLDNLKEEVAKVNSGKYQDEYILKATNLNKLEVKLATFNESVAYKEDSLNQIEARINKNEVGIKEKETNIILCRDEINMLDEESQRCVQIDRDYEHIRDSLEENYAKLISAKKTNSLEYDEVNQKLHSLNEENVSINEALQKIKASEDKLIFEMEHLQNGIMEDYSLTYMQAMEFKKPLEDFSRQSLRVKELKEDSRKLGNVNVESIEEYKEVKERYDFLEEQMGDLTKAKEDLVSIIKDISATIEHRFRQEFNLIQKEFEFTFKELFKGGKARLILTDPNNTQESGVEIEAQPPGKNLKNITQLSGGEKSLTAIALIFAILKIKPAPFTVLDEIDAALDDSNVARFCDFLEKIKHENQFIVITHRKRSMEVADVLYGTTMGLEGITQLISVKLNDIKEGGQLIG